MSISLSIALTHWGVVVAAIFGVLVGAGLIRRRAPLLPPPPGRERLPPPAD